MYIKDSKNSIESLFSLSSDLKKSKTDKRKFYKTFKGLEKLNDITDEMFVNKDDDFNLSFQIRAKNNAKNTTTDNYISFSYKNKHYSCEYKDGVISVYDDANKTLSIDAVNYMHYLFSLPDDPDFYPFLYNKNNKNIVLSNKNYKGYDYLCEKLNKYRENIEKKDETFRNNPSALEYINSETKITKFLNDYIDFLIYKDEAKKYLKNMGLSEDNDKLKDRFYKINPIFILNGANEFVDTINCLNKYRSDSPYTDMLEKYLKEAEKFGLTDNSLYKLINEYLKETLELNDNIKVCWEVIGYDTLKEKKLMFYFNEVDRLSNERYEFLKKELPEYSDIFDEIKKYASKKELLDYNLSHCNLMESTYLDYVTKINNELTTIFSLDELLNFQDIIVNKDERLKKLDDTAYSILLASFLAKQVNFNTVKNKNFNTISDYRNHISNREYVDNKLYNKNMAELDVTAFKYFAVMSDAFCYKYENQEELEKELKTPEFKEYFEYKKRIYLEGFIKRLNTYFVNNKMFLQILDGILTNDFADVIEQKSNLINSFCQSQKDFNVNTISYILFNNVNKRKVITTPHINNQENLHIDFNDKDENYFNLSIDEPINSDSYTYVDEDKGVLEKVSDACNIDTFYINECSLEELKYVVNTFDFKRNQNITIEQHDVQGGVEHTYKCSNLYELKEQVKKIENSLGKSAEIR